MIFRRHIIIKSIRTPVKKDINEDLNWFCRSLGLCGVRDKDQTALKIFKLLVDAAKNGIPLKSDDIARSIGISRGTVIHHIHKLIDSGLVIPTGNAYEMRVRNFSSLVEEIENDSLRILERMKKIAKELDDSLGMPRRE